MTLIIFNHSVIDLYFQVEENYTDRVKEVGKIAKVFVNSALKIQCHVVKYRLLFRRFFPTGCEFILNCSYTHRFYWLFVYIYNLTSNISFLAKKEKNIK